VGVPGAVGALEAAIAAGTLAQPDRVIAAAAASAIVNRFPRVPTRAL